MRNGNGNGNGNRNGNGHVDGSERELKTQIKTMEVVKFFYITFVWLLFSCQMRNEWMSKHDAVMQKRAENTYTHT